MYRAIVEPEQPSAPFKPTDEQAQTSPLLLAAYHQGLTERQVIDLLFRESQERLRHAQRLLETHPSPPLPAETGNPFFRK